MNEKTRANYAHLLHSETLTSLALKKPLSVMRREWYWQQGSDGLVSIEYLPSRVLLGLRHGVSNSSVSFEQSLTPDEARQIALELLFKAEQAEQEVRGEAA